jgi:hypothetical protein
MMKNAKTLILKNFKKNFSTSSQPRHLDLIHQRNQELLNKVLHNNTYSSNDFSNFLRQVNNSKDNSELLTKFSQELPKHIAHLDSLDTRKAISIVLKNSSLHNNEEILSKLKSRFAELKEDLNQYEVKPIKIGLSNAKQPMSVRFWIGYARSRERMYMKIRKSGFLNLQ